MGISNIVRTMKDAHPNKILLLKVGKFFQTYGKDAYIISFLFNYQIKKVETNTNMVGFPEVAQNKVIKTLEDNKIDYMLIDRATSYEVFDECSFNSENKYAEFYSKAHKYISKKNRIDAIYEHLLNNINDELAKEKIQKIEEILYE